MSDTALSAHEHREHAEHAAHERDPFISRVSITIAVLAVLAATAGSLEAVEAGGAVIGSSEAVLHQNQASDAWSEYQADSLKRHLYSLFADAGGPNAARYRQTAAEQQVTQNQVRAHATEAEGERDHQLAQVRVHEHRHHMLTLAATLLEVGIAICTVAIITRRRPFWIGSMLLGAGGAAFLGLTYLL